MAGIAALLNRYQIAKGFPKAQPDLAASTTTLSAREEFPAVFHDVVNSDNIVPCVREQPRIAPAGRSVTKPVRPTTWPQGLGNVDANLFVTNWNSSTNGVNVTLLADPGLRTLNDSVKLTATVLAASGTGTPTGNVAFVITNNSFSPVSLGSVPLTDGRASITVPLYLAQLTGLATMSAQYSGDTAFSSGGATLRVTVTNPRPVLQ